MNENKQPGTMEEPQDGQWEQALMTLEVWAYEKGYLIDFRPEGANVICEISKTIEIDSNVPLETQVYRILHECGHVLIFENGSFYKFSRIKKHNQESSQIYRVFVVLEEAEAWQRAYKLAKRLMIPIEDKRWEDEVVDALGKYIVWASQLEEE